MFEDAKNPNKYIPGPNAYKNDPLIIKDKNTKRYQLDKEKRVSPFEKISIIEKSKPGPDTYKIET